MKKALIGQLQNLLEWSVFVYLWCFFCSQCPAGRVIFQEQGCAKQIDHDSLEDCDICRGSTFQSERGQAICNACPAGRTISLTSKAAENHDSIEDCIEFTISIPEPFAVAFSVTKDKSRMEMEKGVSYISLITWSIDETSLQAILPYTSSFRIELSKTIDFAIVEHTIEGISYKNRSHELNLVLKDPLWKVAMIGRVKVSLQDEEGDWSVKSLPWATSDSCASSWLNNTSPTH